MLQKNQFDQKIATDPAGAGQSTSASRNSPAWSRQSRSVPVRAASLPVGPAVPQQRAAVHPAAAQPAEQHQPVPNQLWTSEPISTGSVCGSKPVWTKPVWAKPVWAKPVFFSKPIWTKSIWSKPVWSKSIWSNPEAKRGNRGLSGGRARRDARLRPAPWEEEEAEKGYNDARAGR